MMQAPERWPGKALLASLLALRPRDHQSLRRSWACILRALIGDLRARRQRTRRILAGRGHLQIRRISSLPVIHPISRHKDFPREIRPRSRHATKSRSSPRLDRRPNPCLHRSSQLRRYELRARRQKIRSLMNRASGSLGILRSKCLPSLTAARADSILSGTGAISNKFEFAASLSHCSDVTEWVDPMQNTTGPLEAE